MKIVVNALELGNERDFSIKGDFQHLVETGVLQQFISQLQDKMEEMDQSCLTTLMRNARNQEKQYSNMLPQDLRTKLAKTYTTLKEKGEDNLAENIEALANHFMNLEQALMTEKSHVAFMESMRPLPMFNTNPQSPFYQSTYPGSCNGYDPNRGMIYAQMTPVPEFNPNRYILNSWHGSPIEQFKMAKFFHDMISHYINSLYILKDKDIEVRYYISKTLYEIQRVQEIIMDLYRNNDSFETKRSDLKSIFEIIFYCNKQIRSLRPDDNIMELKKEVFDKFRQDLENTFVQLKK